MTTNRLALSVLLVVVLALGSYLFYDYRFLRPARRESSRTFSVNRVAIDENQIIYESFADSSLA